MSGGHYDYAYSRIASLCVEGRNDYPLRASMQAVNVMWARVLHDLEWADSGDISQEEFEQSFNSFLNFAAELSRIDYQNKENLEKVLALKEKFLTKEEISQIEDLEPVN